MVLLLGAGWPLKVIVAGRRNCINCACFSTQACDLNKSNNQILSDADSKDRFS